MELKDSLQEIVDRYGDRVYMSRGEQVKSPLLHPVIEEFSVAVCNSVRKMVRDLDYMDFDYAKRTGVFSRPLNPDISTPAIELVNEYGFNLLRAKSIESFNEYGFNLLREKSIERSDPAASSLIAVYRMYLRNRLNYVIAEFTVKDDGKVMSMPHRKVFPDAKRCGIGSMMLGACEALCNENLKLHKREEFLEVDVGQIDVLMWLLKNGYEPVSVEDSKRVNMVFSGDEDLCIGDEYYVFTKDSYDLVINSPYFMESPTYIANSLRVKLRKKVA